MKNYVPLHHIKDVEQMDKETVTIFVSLSLGNIPNGKLKAHLEISPLSQVIASRILGHPEMTGKDIYNFFDAPVLILVAHLSQGNPARSVMYAHSLWVAYKELDKPITMDVFGMELFPDGFPTESALNINWDAQKVSCEWGLDNGLDDYVNWRKG